MLTNCGRGQWLMEDWVRQSQGMLALRFAGLRVGLQANAYCRSWIHLHHLPLFRALGDSDDQGWFRIGPAAVKKTPMFCIYSLVPSSVLVTYSHGCRPSAHGHARLQCPQSPRSEPPRFALHI